LSKTVSTQFLLDELRFGASGNLFLCKWPTPKQVFDPVADLHRPE
jgi:hypothetical protein